MRKAVADLLTRVTDWAASQPHISAVSLVGSYARGEARPDSDVDLVLLCTPPDAFVHDTAWTQLFGVVETCHIEEWGLVTSLRVYYKHGVEVEFGLTIPAWARLPVDAGTRRVVADGMQILLDREEVLARLQHTIRQELV